MFHCLSNIALSLQYKALHFFLEPFILFTLELFQRFLAVIPPFSKVFSQYLVEVRLCEAHEWNCEALAGKDDLKSLNPPCIDRLKVVDLVLRPESENVRTNEEVKVR